MAASPSAGPAPFVTCPLCGDASPPGSVRCRTCGATTLLQPGQEKGLPPKQKRWYTWVRWGRILVIVAVVGLLGALMVQAAFTPAPIAADPLTQNSTNVVPPGGVWVLNGAITGSDYIQGNYTVTSPPGALLTLTVYNSTEYNDFVHGLTTGNQETLPASASSVFVFDAPYTDTFYFVWSNQYPPASGLNLTVFVHSDYEANVLIA